MGALEEVRHWHGTSIGSICALCMNVSISPNEIHSNISKIENLLKITPQSIISIPDTYGMIPHTPLIHLLEHVLESNGILP